MTEAPKLKLFDDKLRETDDPFPPMGESLSGEPRREARLCATQAIYQNLLLEEKSLPEISKDFAPDLKIRQADSQLFDAILHEVHTGKERFLEIIQAHLNEKWTLDRLPLLEKSLLLAALGEFYAKPDTPPAVIINEFVTLAKGFMDDAKAKFINAVLDGAAKKIRA